jgi:hypothetical protein
MASILKVDELQGIASAGAITVTSEGGAATQSLQQGLAKCWANLNGATFGLRDSFSVASAVDNGTGDYTINFSNTMNNSNYSSVATGDGTGVSNIVGVDTSLGRSGSPTTNCVISTKTSSASADLSYVYLNVTGDLA